MNIAVVTATLGAYDTLRPIPAQTVPCEAFAVIDGDADGWQVLPAPGPHAHPRMRAKVPKCRPDLYAHAGLHIWIDGSFQVLEPDFVRWCVDSLGDGDLGMIRHPDRQSILAEAEVSAGMPKYQGQQVREQAADYVRRGYEDRFGMWATGLIVSRPTARVKALGDAWLREQLRWTYQDQISLPPLLEEFGIVPVDLPGPLYPNPRFTIRHHHRED